ncbi:MAG TPA: antibiotic biosynthesis monooxygenase [Acidimicrobiales bacterium]|nr:antibiotic biosynthesis monooxygenase [Acidimicrobiales bacterium]
MEAVMTEFLRVFQSAVDPDDIEAVRQFFADDVTPAFTGMTGCLGVELLISREPSAGGLVEGAALSRWSSAEAMDEAMSSRPVREALVRVTALLRQQPVTRVFEVMA